tara:strand:+ start:598 stop:1356 length:759 start_codon:yes stop_codon:yes gene_type:complete
VKYNILTVLNESYKAFGELFVTSLFENLDISKINKTYIFDTGLSEDTRNYLSLFPTVQVVDTEIDSQSGEIHDDGWKNSTYSKTRFLMETIVQDGLPTVMIDSDCIFVYDFYDLLDFDSSDIVVTARNREGFSRHIGSFFSANNASKKTISFISRWIENLEDLQKNTDMKHVESPALSKTVSEMKDELEILEVPENIICCVIPDGPPKNARIYHLKSDYYAKTIPERLQLPHAKAFIYYLRSSRHENLRLER